MHSGTSYHVRRCPARRLAGANCPQQSTAFVSPSQNSRNLTETSDVPYRRSTDERVSCICQEAGGRGASRTATGQAARGRAVCRSVSRSVRPMWSRAVAARMANCAYFRAIWSCPAASASTLPRTLPVRRRPAPAAARAAGAKIRAKSAKNAVPPGLKKLWPAAEPLANTAVNCRRRAKPPSPSPSITRRRTPAVLAAGVHLFGVGRIRSQQAPSEFVSDPR
jgi:hypothetical protein